jgi:hypothetical protein
LHFDPRKNKKMAERRDRCGLSEKSPGGSAKAIDLDA